MACYQQAELHRLRGEFAKAEQAYRQASQCGRTPQPGLAQLRLTQGRVDAAAAAIRTALDEAQDRVARSKVLAAYVEIVLAAGDVSVARAAADELTEIAGDVGAPLLHAAAAHAQGAVLLAEGDAKAALAALAPRMDEMAGNGRPIRGRARGYSSAWRAAPSRTGTARRWSWTRPGWSSSSSARSPS